MLEAGGKLMLVDSISKLTLATLLSVSRAARGTLGTTKRDSLSSRIKQLTERNEEVSFLCRMVHVFIKA